MGEPRRPALPPELQARLEVATTLGAHVAALRHLTDAIGQVLTHEAPEFSAFGVALDSHVRFLELYFQGAERDAWGVRALGMRLPMDWGRDGG